MSPPPIPPRTELEKAVDAAVERVTGDLRAQIAALQAVDRRHSSTHGKLAENVRAASEEALKARATASDAKKDANEELMAAVRFVSGAIATRAEIDDQRHEASLRTADAMNAKLEYLYREVSAVKADSAAAARRSKESRVAASSAALATQQAARLAVHQRTTAERYATIRTVIVCILVPLLGMLEHHCGGL